MSAIIVGHSDPEFWYKLEGKDPATTCRQCDGDGVLAITDRAGCFPDQYPDELISCDRCHGTGLIKEKNHDPSPAPLL